MDEWTIWAIVALLCIANAMAGLSAVIGATSAMATQVAVAAACKAASEHYAHPKPLDTPPD